MSEADEHRRRAAECFVLAKETTDQATKVLLLEMAQTWVQLAEQERNKTDDPNRSVLY